MSDALLGVIIGGLIASVGPLVTLYANNRKWKHEKTLARLERQIDQLNTLLNTIGESSAIEGSFSDARNHILAKAPLASVSEKVFEELVALLSEMENGDGVRTNLLKCIRDDIKQKEKEIAKLLS